MFEKLPEDMIQRLCSTPVHGFQVRYIVNGKSILYIHRREEGLIGLYIPDDQGIPRGPRHIPGVKADGKIVIQA